MKFIIPTLALLGLAAAAELTTITCPLGQNQCGSGCVVGTCCDQETAKFCHTGETCTTLNGIVGCCPQGKNCTSTEAPSCLNKINARCQGDNPESICCTAEAPFCLSDTGKCTADLFGDNTAPSTSTSTTQVHVTVKPTPIETAAPVPTAVAEEETYEGDSDFDEGIELEDEEEAAPVTRTEEVETTSTISIPVCGATSTAPCTTATIETVVPVATVEPEAEEECETFTRTKIVPVSTIWENVPVPTATPSGKPSPSKNSTIVTQPSQSLPPQQQVGAASGLKVGGSLMAVVVAVLAMTL